MISLLVQGLTVVLCVVGCVVVGKWIGGKVFRVKKDVSGLKKSAQSLAIALREHGLVKLPEVLEALTVGDIDDVVQAIKDGATVVRAGNQAIVAELEKAFDKSLVAKLQTPEGRAVVKAKLEVAEKVAVEVAKVVGPVVLTAAIAAI